MTQEKRKFKEPREEPFRGMDAVKARQEELELAQRRAIYAIRAPLNFDDFSSLEILARNIYEYQTNQRYAYRFELTEQLRQFIAFVRKKMVFKEVYLVSSVAKLRNKLREELMIEGSDKQFENALNNTQLSELALQFDYIRNAMHESNHFLMEIYEITAPLGSYLYSHAERFFDYLGRLDKYSSFADYVERTIQDE